MQGFRNGPVALIVSTILRSLQPRNGNNMLSIGGESRTSISYLVIDLIVFLWLKTVVTAPSYANITTARAKLLRLQPNLALPTNFSTAVAKITDGFSFAYLQETFVSALLSLARSGSSPASSLSHNATDSGNAIPSKPSTTPSSPGSLEETPIWQAIKSQVETLCKEMKDSPKSVEDAERNSIASDPRASSGTSAGFGLGR